MFHSYEYFLAIVQFKNITKAANFLHISQPSLSKYLVQLETRLGTTLFDRKSTPLTLTKDGEVYLSYVKKYVSLIHKLEAELSHEALPELTVNIGIPYWRSTQILPTILKSYTNTLNNYKVNVTEHPGKILTDLVLQDALDFCFLNIPYAIRLHEDLYFEFLEREKIDLVVNKNNPLSKKTVIKPQDIDFQNIILLQDNQFLTIQVKHILEFLGITPKTIFTTVSLNTALSIINQEDYVTFVPNSRYKSPTPSDNLVYLPIDDDTFSFDFGIAYLKSRKQELSKKIRIVKQLYR